MRNEEPLLGVDAKRIVSVVRVNRGSEVRPVGGLLVHAASFQSAPQAGAVRGAAHGVCVAAEHRVPQPELGEALRVPSARRTRAVRAPDERHAGKIDARHGRRRARSQ